MLEKLIEKKNLADLRLLHLQSGIEGTEETTIEDYQKIKESISTALADDEQSAFRSIMEYRFMKDDPPEKVTDLQFDDLAEATDYCRRMKESHGVECAPVEVGFKRWKVV